MYSKRERDKAVRKVLKLLDNVQTCRFLGVTCITRAIAHVAEEDEISQSAISRWYHDYISCGDVMGKALAPARKEERKRHRDESRLETPILEENFVDLAEEKLDEDAAYSLEKLCLEIYKEFGYACTKDELYASLRKRGYVSKILEHYMIGVDMNLVKFFQDYVFKEIPTTCMLFADGMETNPSDCFKKRGFAKKGKKAVTHHNIASKLKKGAGSCCAFPVISIDGLETIFCTDPCEMVSQDTTRRYFREVAEIMQPWPGPFSVLFIDNSPNYDKEWVLAHFVLKGIRCVFLPPGAPRTNACEPLHALARHWIKTNYGYASKPMNVLLSEAFNNVVTSEVVQSEYAKIGAHLSEWERVWLQHRK